MKKGVLRIFKLLLLLAGLLALVAIGYVLYFFAFYHRIDDHQQLAVANAPGAQAVQPGTSLTITSYNIGFGAYSADFSFFMDGGTQSWAFSEDAVNQNTAGAMQVVRAQQPDFCLFQEVDLDSTRSYHVDQLALMQQQFSDMGHLYAIDFDSPFLFYPLLQPHGRCYSSIVTLSRFAVNSAERRSLPIDQGLSRLVDLDRCFDVAELDVTNGKKLYLYNVHLSAYSNESTTVEAQVRLLAEDIESRRGNGNYIIIGGDFNQDMLPSSAEVFGTTAQYSWTRPLDTSLLPAFCRVVQPTDPDARVPSCRLADSPYVPGESFVITIDGFIVSDNIAVSSLSTIDTGFAWSDHNPVRMDFALDE